MKRYRRYFGIFVVLVMLFAMMSPSVATAAVDYSNIKVVLNSMNTNGVPTSVQFKVDGAFRIAEASSVDLYRNVTYTIKVDGAGMKLTYSNGASTVSVSLPGTATFVQYASSSAHNFIYVNNPAYGWCYYSGNMTFSLATEKKTNKTYVQLVNTVYLETYLYGVIAYEMGNDWPVEALKAQAVCARTYAVRYIKANPGASYHIGDTSAAQVYHGYPLDSNGNLMQNVVAAVDGTRGKVIVIGDPSQLNFADGVYSASNGGQIRTAKMRWGSTNTYHVFKDDPYDLNNANSSTFQFIFPVTNDSATLSALSANDQSKVQSMLALIMTKLPAALLNQQKIACDPTAITINGISAAEPSGVRPDVPDGSREFTKVTVTVNVTASGTSMPKPIESVSYQGVNIDNGALSPSVSNGTDFGEVAVGADSSALPTTKYIITNGGTAPLTIQSVTITGDNKGDFTLTNPLPTTINPPGNGSSGNAEIAVTFKPSALGTRVATVTITSNDPKNSTFTFAIKGTGVAAAQTSDKALGAAVQSADQQDSPDASKTDDTQSGGGAMPDVYTGNVTVDLGYISQATDGGWDVIGELRTQFSNYNKYLNTTYYWELYSSASADGKYLYVTARGFGHGVGLSQRGAQEMAREGKSCGDILDFYYNISAGKSGTATLSTSPKTLSQMPGNSSKTWGKVTSTTLNIRAVADSSKGILQTTLAKGDIVEILSTSGSWYRVLQNSTGIIGYCITSGLTKTSTGPTAPPATATPTPVPTPTPTGATPTPAATPTPLMGRVDASSLSIRASANASAALVYTLDKNDIVIVLDTNVGDNWYKVKYGSYVGYCVSGGTSAVYIDIVGSAPAPTGTGTAAPSSGPITPPTVKGTVNISSGTLTVHASASTTSAKKGTLAKGASVTVVAVSSADKAWLQISTSSVSGYVKAQYIAVSGNTSYRACTITSNNINVRGGAGTTYPIIGTVSANNTFVCTQVTTSGSYTWYKIYCGSTLGYGYVSSQFARLSTTS